MRTIEECMSACPIVGGLPEETQREIISTCASMCLNGPSERQALICGADGQGAAEAKNTAVRAATKASRLAITKV